MNGINKLLGGMSMILIYFEICSRFFISFGFASHLLFGPYIIRLKKIYPKNRTKS